MAEKCKKEGCNSWSLKNADGYCFVHSETNQQARDKARMKGGYQRKHKLDIERIDFRTAEQIRILLSECLNELRQISGQTLQKNRTIGAICSIFLANITQCDIEQRLNAIEDALNKQ